MTHLEKLIFSLTRAVNVAVNEDVLDRDEIVMLRAHIEALKEQAKAP